HRAKTVARDVNDVVDAAKNPEVTVVVLARAVACEIAARNLTPLGGLETIIVAVNRAQHARPRLVDDQKSAGAASDFFALFIDDLRLDAKEGQRRRSGNGRRHAGQRRNHDGAGLRLPPRVDDGTTPAADDVAIPHPSFGID